MRPTRAIIHLQSIQNNVEKIIKKYPNYTYYMGVVKANCYGYRGLKVVDRILKAGANILAVSLVEEAITLREAYPTLPILLLNPIANEDIQLCKENNFILTVARKSHALPLKDIEGVQVMLRVNGGSDILGGPTNQEEFMDLFNVLNDSCVIIKGFYLHSYNAHSKEDTFKEYANFEYLTQAIDLNSFDIISIESSLSLPLYEKREYANCCRLGNIMYNIETHDPDFQSTFTLESKILSVFTIHKGQHIAYDHAYTAKEEKEYIANMPIGFGDGFSKSNIGRHVYINKKAYPIIAITMDISHVLVDETVQEGDLVEVISDTYHLDSISEHIHGATEEAICALNDRVRREYIED